ncbi:MAG: hypothetical protein KI790_05760 [Cyclobacteriaceae bacterium]|nr:hypothetical protein [Cyclobacteriaceae bacterium HetDA_MAG_MS6]
MKLQRNTQFSLMIAVLVCLILAINNQIQAQAISNIESRTAKVTGQSDLSTIGAANDVMVTKQYFDGLGRPVQHISRWGAPDLNDLVTPTAYDQYGRQSKQYLPYVNAGSQTGAYQSAWDSHINTFYDNTTNKTVTTNYYWSETEFESSPLNRVLKSYAPGAPWTRTSGNKPATFAYRPNTQGAGLDNIDHFEIANNAGQTITRLGYYSANELWVTTSTDENGSEMLEFKDKEGRLVAKKSEVSSGTFATTYYLYDDYSSLTFVIPPEAVSLASSNWSQLNDGIFRKNWLFRYQYDGRRRMVEKQVPGAEPVFMVYDERDRLVLTQDGNQRDVQLVSGTNLAVDVYEGKSYQIESGGTVTLQDGFVFSSSGTNSFQVSESVDNQRWTFTKYDHLNRPVMTGIVEIPGDRSTVQALVSSHADLVEEYTGSGTLYGYNNTGYPTQVTSENLLTVTYYDHYDFKADQSWPGALNHTTNAPQTIAKGLTTGSLTRVLGTNTMLRGISYYDGRYRVLASIFENQKGGTDKVETTYHNVVHDRVESVKTTHDISGQSTVTVNERYEYDHMDRVLRVYHKINSDPEQLIVENEYNPIGQLVEKDLHAGLQSVDYRYNERGWLTTINSGESFDEGNDVFGMRLMYEDAPSGHQQYSGNIGAMKWRSLDGNGVGEKQQYDFTYDKMNRLSKAEFLNLDDNTKNNRYTVDGPAGAIEYDLNGNIEKLRRNGEVGGVAQVLDNLTYTYASGNQLSNVSDGGNTSAGFEDVVNTIDYTYDANGNMNSDLNKSISTINYNHMNLPELVAISTGQVGYTYDALGTKLSKSSTTTTDYIGLFQYEENSLKHIFHEEGRVVKIGNNWVYHYDIKDHLGNSRVTIDENLTTNTVGVLETTTRNFDDGVIMPSDNGTFNSANPYSGTRSWRLYEDSDYITIDVSTGDQVSASVWTKEAPSANARLRVSFYPAGSTNSTTLSSTDNSAADNVWQQLQSGSHTITEAGQVRITIYETSEASAYFDDLVISHNKTVSIVTGAIQRDDYYPFGMSFNSYTSGTENLYKLTGNEEQKEWSTYDFNARMYDVAIGRFNSIDPLADVTQESWNPYHSNYNNPLKFTDPTGYMPEYNSNTTSIQSSFIAPDGTILDVRDDGDNNIYLIHCLACWNPSGDENDKDGLAKIGQTPEPATLKSKVGKNLYTKEVYDFIFDEGERLSIQPFVFGRDAFEAIKELMKSRDQQIKLLEKIKLLRIKMLWAQIKLIRNGDMITLHNLRKENSALNKLLKYELGLLSWRFGKSSGPAFDVAIDQLEREIQGFIEEDFDSGREEIIQSHNIKIKALWDSVNENR